MFKSTITQTAMTSEAANVYFGTRISANTYNSDDSMKATLRALLHRRMPKDATISAGTYRCSYNESALRDGASIIKDMLYNKITVDKDFISIVSISGTATYRNGMMELIEKEFISVEKECANKDYEQLKNVSELFKNSFAVLAFICKADRSVVIFVDNLNLSKYHFLQCALLGMMPWYHTKEFGMTDDEKALIYSFRETDDAKYIEAINKLASGIDMESGRIHKLLDGFEKEIDRRRIESLNSNVVTCRRDIESYLNSIADLYTRINDYLISISGLENKISDDGDNELADYFIRNKRLQLERVNRDVVYFNIFDYLEYFDEDAAKKVIKNKNSYIYRYTDNNSSAGVTKTEMERLATAIFLDQEIKVRFCAAFYIDIRRSLCSYNSSPNFGTRGINYLPNTHIHRYGCLGGNSSRIAYLMGNGDYIGAIEQCIASCRSLNLHDSTVDARFFGEIDDPDKKIFELPDGRVVNIKEAATWAVENAD